MDPSAGHQGVKCTISRISEHFKWPGMVKDVQATVSVCNVLLNTESCKNTLQNLQGHLWLRSAWEKVIAISWESKPSIKPIEENSLSSTSSCNHKSLAHLQDLLNSTLSSDHTHSPGYEYSANLTHSQDHEDAFNSPNSPDNENAVSFSNSPEHEYNEPNGFRLLTRPWVQC